MIDAAEQAAPNVTVVDALMGAGKTTVAINLLDDIASSYETIFEDGAQRFIYITPFLDEVERVRHELAKHKGVIAFEPLKKNGRKLDHLNEMIAEGRNIVSTHSLFSHTDQRTYDALDNFQYTLFIDEVAEWVARYSISPRDLELLYAQGILSVDQTTRRIIWTDPPGEPYKGKFDELRSLCMQGKIVASRFGNEGNPTLLLWVFPVEMLSRFKSVYILTHLFDGSDMAAYLRLHQVEVRKATIGRDRCSVVDYDETIERERLTKVRPLITVVEDPKLNAVGTRTGRSQPLSVSWFKADHHNGGKQTKKLKEATYNFFRNKAATKSSENLWSTFEPYESKLSAKGYARAFLACNARATNDFRARKSLAYLVNLHHHPFIRAYFEDAGVNISEDYYALLTMTQWIWRSRIRERKPILLFVPSERMRKLLLDWLDGRLPKMPEKGQPSAPADSTELEDLVGAVDEAEQAAPAGEEAEAFA